jgi:hypothetical protein
VASQVPGASRRVVRVLAQAKLGNCAGVSGHSTSIKQNPLNLEKKVLYPLNLGFFLVKLIKLNQKYVQYQIKSTQLTLEKTKGGGRRILTGVSQGK